MPSMKFLLVLIAIAFAPQGLARSLHQAGAPAPSSEFVVPINSQIYETNTEALAAATAILSQAGQVDEAGIQEVTLDGAHEAAEGLFYAAYAGQASAVHAGVATAGAALLAAGGALTNDAAVISEAQMAIAQATELNGAIQDVNILSVARSGFADLVLLANMAHDGTLVHYWQNVTSGPMDNATFAEQVETAANVYEVVEEQLENGLSESLAVLGGQEIASNLLAAIYTFQGNNSAVAQENIAIARVLLKAVRVQQTGEQCSVTWEQIDPAVETAVETTTAATTSLTATDLMSATMNSEAALTAAMCSAVAPALAPAATAAAGRK